MQIFRRAPHLARAASLSHEVPIMRIIVFSCALMLGSVCITEFAAAQSATSCANEAQRLSDGFPSSSGNTLAQQPGTRAGSSLNADGQQQMRNLTQQAQSAGNRGDTAGCMQNLNQARSLLRQSGVGPAPVGSGGALRDTNPGTGTNINGAPLPGDSADRLGSSGTTPRSATPNGQSTTPGNQNAEAPATPPTRNSTRARGLGGSGSGSTGGSPSATGGGTGSSTSGSSGSSGGSGGR
jgi:hypothetical protein